MARSVIQLMQTPEFKRRLEERFAKLFAEKERLGLPKAVVIDEVVLRQFPDGRMEPVDRRRASSGPQESDSC